MMIFKNMSIAISTSIICASLFFGDVNATEFNVMKYLHTFKDNKDEAKINLNNALNTIDSLPNTTFKKIEELNDNAFYVFTKYKMKHETKQKLLKYLIDQEKQNTKKFLILVLNSYDNSKTTKTWRYSMFFNGCDYNSIKKAKEQLNKDKLFKELLQETNDQSIQKWTEFSSDNPKDNTDNIFSICYDTCHGNAAEIIKLFLGDNKTEIGNTKRQDILSTIISSENDKKLGIIENIRNAFIKHIAKHFIIKSDLPEEQKEIKDFSKVGLGEFASSNFFPKDEKETKTHGFCYITSGKFSTEKDKKTAISNLLAYFVKNADFSQYVTLIEKDNVTILPKHRVPQDKRKEKKCIKAVNTNILFENFEYDTASYICKIDGKKVNDNEVDKDKIINDLIDNGIKKCTNISNSYLDASFKRITDKTLLDLFFQLTIQYSFDENHVGSLYVIS